MPSIQDMLHVTLIPRSYFESEHSYASDYTLSHHSATAPGNFQSQGLSRFFLVVRVCLFIWSLINHQVADNYYYTCGVGVHCFWELKTLLPFFELLWNAVLRLHSFRCAFVLRTVEINNNELSHSGDRMHRNIRLQKRFPYECALPEKVQDKNPIGNTKRKHQEAVTVAGALLPLIYWSMDDARRAARMKRSLANRAAGLTHDLAAHQKQKTNWKKYTGNIYIIRCTDEMLEGIN